MTFHRTPRSNHHVALTTYASAVLIAGCVLSAGQWTTVDRAYGAELARAVIPSSPSPEGWNGAYGGIHVGFGFANSRFGAQTLVPLDNGAFAPIDRGSTRVSPPATDPTLRPTIGGFQIGFNHVFAGRFLFGLEADTVFPDDMRSDKLVVSPFQTYNVRDEIKAFGTARLRVGVATPGTLLYATAGFAVARDQLVRTQISDMSIGGRVNAGDANTFYQWRYGFAVGAGAEVPFYANWSAKIEYLYMRFPGATGTFVTEAQRYTSDLQTHTVRLGLNYHFGDRPEFAALPPLVDPANWSIHGQSTFLPQNAFAFPARYSGTNSLDTRAQLRETLSATAFIGTRLPTGTELYVNPEPFQGFGLSNTKGLAAFPSNEAQKAGFNYPHFNVSRLFARHVIGFGGEQETVEDGANQVAGQYDVSRLTVTAGKMAVPDLFDGNAYSHDARTSFINWAFVDGGAFDYAADQKGYTWGAVVELNQKKWAARTGYFLVPVAPNANRIDTRLASRGQYIGELETRFTLLDQPGKLRLTGFYTRAVAGSFDETVFNPAYAFDVTATRRNRPSTGLIVNLEQAVTDDLGIFSRFSLRRGTTEVVAYTDIDRSFSVGSVLKGTSWGRPDDKVGIAGAVSGLSGAYRRFLALGGLGINIGDGALNYRRESVGEAYYAFSLGKGVSLTADFQQFRNPAYNADRGPNVSVASIKLHGEF